MMMMSGDDGNGGDNDVMIVATIEHAMVGQLKNPFPGFEDAIQTHFFLQQGCSINSLRTSTPNSSPYDSSLLLTSTNQSIFHCCGE